MMLTAARRAGRRGRVVLAAVLVALALLATYLTVTLRYRLDDGNIGANPQASSSVTAGHVTEYRYVARPGGSIEYGFSIANRGPITVRLEDVVRDDGPGFAVEQVHTNLDVDRGIERGKAALFRPIDIPAGEQILLWVTLRFSDDFLLNYRIPCAGFSFETQRIRFNVLGLQREQSVPIGYFVSITTPAADGGPCRSDG
ncbi:hypothetical protein AB0C15_31935 [Micromonospora sp. NPDC048835]|uniref:hypothetical protein n=1 Tax=Micromonospora sp. NPDC048835 TaxID=3155147 RepID=UPI0033EF6961